MKKFSTRLILLILLFVVGPIIQKKVMGIQQKGNISAPISESDESSFNDEKEECDCLVICPLQKSFNCLTLQFPFSFLASILFFSTPDNIVLPPPQL